MTTRLTLALGRSAARRAWLLLSTAAGLIVLSTFTDLDLRLADAFYDERVKNFSWRHAWLTEHVNHLLLKRALTGLGLAIIALVLIDLARPIWRTSLRRLQLRVIALSAVLVPLVVACLKSLSSSHCPWDLDRYGGAAPYVRLLDQWPAGLEAGQCMPAGHAASALWLIALAVLYLPARPRHAWRVFSLLLALGLGVGWLQQMRGAHFLSHTLWSAWIACTVFFMLLQCTWTTHAAGDQPRPSGPVADVLDVEIHPL